MTTIFESIRRDDDTQRSLIAPAAREGELVSINQTSVTDRLDRNPTPEEAGIS